MKALETFLLVIWRGHTEGTGESPAVQNT